MATRDLPRKALRTVLRSMGVHGDVYMGYTMMRTGDGHWRVPQWAWRTFRTREEARAMIRRHRANQAQAMATFGGGQAMAEKQVLALPQRFTADGEAV